ncbi:hypothetical protein [uncultured Acinetobacter sp.]|uniref:hypothetical protein n=1 Tax=uncultured Acinetobacter sp. TaxID=165433 RepID=UPI00258F225E|nr:hypothetical protein [uncultured Acinetobacter sp.]
MLYVIAFIFLLVVAIILKKRQDQKKAPHSSKVQAPIAQGHEHVHHAPFAVAESLVPATIDPNIQDRIEQLIEIGHLSAAEALINQTLNRDPSRHHFYFYLLDLHLRQQDELGVKQLLQNLEQRQLHEVLAEVQVRYQAAQKKPAPTETPSTNIVTPSNQTPIPDVVVEHKVDTTISPPQQPTPEPQPILEANQALEFKLNTPVPPTPVQVNVEPASVPKVSTPEAEQPAKQTEQQTAPAAVELTNTASTLPLAPMDDAAATAQASSSSSTSPASSTPQVIFAELDGAEAESEALSPETTIATPVTIKPQDPLVKAFPELADIDEVQLDLDLAQQYIELGAFESACILLEKNDARFNQEQRDLSKKLLNRIASSS